MLVCEGTVMGVAESAPRQSRDGESFTTWTLQVFGGGDYPHYLDLPKNFDRSTIPATGQPVRAAVAVRPYPSASARNGAGASLTLRAILPALPVPATV